MSNVGPQSIKAICPFCGKKYKSMKLYKRHQKGCTKPKPGYTPPQQPPQQAQPQPPQAPQQPADNTVASPEVKPFDPGSFHNQNNPNEVYQMAQQQPQQSQQPGQFYPPAQQQPQQGQQPENPGYGYSFDVQFFDTINDALNNHFGTKDFRLGSVQKQQLREALGAVGLKTEDPKSAIFLILAIAWGPPLLLHLDKKYDIFGKIKKSIQKHKDKKETKKEEAAADKARKVYPIKEEPKAVEVNHDHKRKADSKNPQIRQLSEFEKYDDNTIFDAICPHCQDVFPAAPNSAKFIVQYGCLGCNSLKWKEISEQWR